MIYLTLALLAIMEVSLSFDNAVLNAAVLRNMSHKWQQRFLTWGILIAVFGMRLVFPVLIVTIAAALPVMQVIDLVINDPTEYGRHLSESHINIASFGGMFLLMVFLKFICDATKEVHWLGWAERKLSVLGKLEAIEISLALLVLMFIQFGIPAAEQTSSLISGIIGIFLYVFINSIMGLCDAGEGAAVVAKQGLVAFVYLEVLDASCSLDGVIGAFAMTNNIAVIMIGLGIGAFAIRSLTLYLVRGGVLQNYIYLEHGAHYGIGALAIIMLASALHPVPEAVTGMIGISFILASLVSSINHNRRQLIKV